MARYRGDVVGGNVVNEKVQKVVTGFFNWFREVIDQTDLNLTLGSESDASDASHWVLEQLYYIRDELEQHIKKMLASVASTMDDAFHRKSFHHLLDDLAAIVEGMVTDTEEFLACKNIEGDDLGGTLACKVDAIEDAVDTFVKEHNASSVKKRKRDQTKNTRAQKQRTGPYNPVDPSNLDGLGCFDGLGDRGLYQTLETNARKRVNVPGVGSSSSNELLMTRVGHDREDCRDNPHGCTRYTVKVKSTTGLLYSATYCLPVMLCALVEAGDDAALKKLADLLPAHKE